MISYIVITRNPTSNELFVLRDEDRILEFETEDDAIAAALRNPACRAWGAEVLPLDRPRT
jgi:hypothetical protein